MKYLQNIWRSVACLIVSAVCIFGLMYLAIKATPTLFQDSVWGKIGILAIGIELGAMGIYFAMALIHVCCASIAGNRLTPRIMSALPIIYVLIRYPWWLISVSLQMPLSLGFWQWLILITWSITWVVTLGFTIGGLFSDIEKSECGQHKA